MAKLIKILAASVGGGLVLGAGIRLGEVIASRNPAASPEMDDQVAERFDRLEGRLSSLERAGDGRNVPPAERDREVHAAMARSEIRDWLEEAVTSRMSDAELRLRAESERGRQQILDAVAEQIQSRLIQRISKLEEEVAGQSAAMSELRECSLRTERSMQRLLGGLEKLIVRHPAAPEEGEASPSGSGALHEVA